MRLCVLVHVIFSESREHISCCTCSFSFSFPFPDRLRKRVKTSDSYVHVHSLCDHTTFCMRYGRVCACAYTCITNKYACIHFFCHLHTCIVFGLCVCTCKVIPTCTSLQNKYARCYIILLNTPSSCPFFAL